MQSKNLLITIALAIAVGAASFYGGTVYQKNKSASPKMIRGNSGGQGGQRQGGMIRNTQNNGEFSNGEIVSKDDKSITIKTKDGSSKIIYFSGETSIGKSTSGNSSDLGIGEEVMINGKNNSDGSLSAQNIQIRPGITQQD